MLTPFYPALLKVQLLQPELLERWLSRIMNGALRKQ